MRSEALARLNGHHSGNRRGAVAPRIDGDPRLALPRNIDAEAHVIACAILHPETVPQLVAILGSADPFYLDAHQEIWQVVLEEYSRGATITPVTMLEALEHRGRGDLAEASNRDSLFSILDRPAMPWGVLQDATVVQQKSVLRATMEAAEEILRDGYSNLRSADDVLAGAMMRLQDVARQHSVARTLAVSDLLPAVRARIEDRQNGARTGVESGIFALDAVTDGFQPQDLILLAARPSMGKTALALNICEFISVDRGQPTIFVSLEMSPDSLAERLLISRARVDGRKTRTGGRLTADERTRLDAAQGDLDAGAKVYIIERPGSTFVHVCQEIRSARSRHGAVLAVVDYAQLIGSDNPRDSEVQAITKVSGAMKALGRELNLPIVLLSQLNRKLEAREDHTPRMHDLRGSGSLEQDADLVLFLHRPEYYKPGERVGEADLILAKNRNGPIDTFKLSFQKECMRFQDFVPQLAAVPPGAPF